MKKATICRCSWVTDDPLYIDYHDQEWGVPVHDDLTLFAMLNLEGQQAGLSWITILKKRAHYFNVFDQFNPSKIVKYNQAKINALLLDAGIIRNKLKINAVISNAKAFLEFECPGDFSDFLWKFVDGHPLKFNDNQPAFTPESEAMSKALKKHGFKFVGPTICYAFMQAVGMVNDHEPNCYKHVV